MRRFRSRHVNLPDIEDWPPYVAHIRPMMDAFDQLSPEMRKALRNAAVPYDPQMAFDYTPQDIHRLDIRNYTAHGVPPLINEE